MRKGMELYTLENKVLATIETAQVLGKAQEEAIQFAMQNYDLTEEQVKELIMPKAV